MTWGGPISRIFGQLVDDERGWIIIPIWWSRRVKPSGSSDGGGCGCCGLIGVLIGVIFIGSLLVSAWQWATGAWWRIPLIIIAVLLLLALIGAVSDQDGKDRE